MRKPVVLLGHSLGGIVVKEVSHTFPRSFCAAAFLNVVTKIAQAILKMMDAEQPRDEEVLKSITGILLFGVPNQGMEIESLLPMVQNQPNESLIRTLRHNSERLIEQSQQFLKRFQGEWRGIDLDIVKIFCFYETRRSPTAQKVRHHILIVPPMMISQTILKLTLGKDRWHLENEWSSYSSSEEIICDTRAAVGNRQQLRAAV